jgi:excisionase family DNA binding protein
MNSSILTLEELADYLKLSPEVVLKQASQGRLPGRKIEDTWRFLKDAIDDWLRTVLLHKSVLRMGVIMVGLNRQSQP